jgi:hypothetical protein
VVEIVVEIVVVIVAETAVETVTVAVAGVLVAAVAIAEAAEVRCPNPNSIRPGRKVKHVSRLRRPRRWRRKNPPPSQE